MTTAPIPLLEIRGSHREVGRQIGERMKPTLEAILPRLRQGFPLGVTWEQVQHQGRLYLAHSRAVYPQYIDELEGVAEGAGLPFEELFVALCEELWEPAAWREGVPDLKIPAGFRSDRPLERGCTDLLARGRATADGSTLVAHTNDLSPEGRRPAGPR